MKRTQGVSMVETLVVLTIIGIMLAIAVPHYTKAIRLAKDVAAEESIRQNNLVRDDLVSFDCAKTGGDLRVCARNAYRQTYDAGKFDIHVTELLYEVNSDAEFEAYWHTLIGPAEDVFVETTADGSLVAYNAFGEQYVLPAIEQTIVAGDKPRLLGWEFLSVNMGHMNSEKRGTRVLYSDGSRKEVRYPDPIGTQFGSISSQLVAELSNRYMNEVYSGA